ncbi:hypothetical protein Hanom_Chr12g01080101 [Helianthus anomalus]
MDEVNEPDENGMISNLLDPNANKQIFERKSHNWPNLRDENGILRIRRWETIEYATYETYLALSRANSASNFSLHTKNVSMVTGSPCGTII